MSVRALAVSLVASIQFGTINENDFLIPLNIEEDSDCVVEVYSGKELEDYFGGIRNQTINFFFAESSSFPLEDNFSEPFFDAIEAHLLKVALWIDKRRATLRETGKNLELKMVFATFVDLDGANLTLPPSFLAACGKAEIEIEFICSKYWKED